MNLFLDYEQKTRDTQLLYLEKNLFYMRKRIDARDISSNSTI